MNTHLQEETDFVPREVEETRMDLHAQNRELKSKLVVSERTIERLKAAMLDAGFAESDIVNAIVGERSAVPVEEVIGGESSEQDSGSGEGGATSGEEPGHGSSTSGEDESPESDEDPGEAGSDSADERSEASSGS